MIAVPPDPKCQKQIERFWNLPDGPIKYIIYPRVAGRAHQELFNEHRRLQEKYEAIAKELKTGAALAGLRAKIGEAGLRPDLIMHEGATALLDLTGVNGVSIVVFNELSEKRPLFADSAGSKTGSETVLGLVGITNGAEKGKDTEKGSGAEKNGGAGGKIGELTLYHDGVLGEEKTRHAETAAFYLSRALSNALVSHQDAVTGLFDFKFFNMFASSRIELIKQKHARGETVKPFSIMVVDIDKLHSINTERGMAGGDDVLKRFADILRRTLRVVRDSPDLVVTRRAEGRGDEFLALLAEVPSTLASRAALRLFESKHPGFTFSVGLASFDVETVRLGLEELAKIQAGESNERIAQQLQKLKASIFSLDTDVLLDAVKTAADTQLRNAKEYRDTCFVAVPPTLVRGSEETAPLTFRLSEGGGFVHYVERHDGLQPAANYALMSTGTLVSLLDALLGA